MANVIVLKDKNGNSLYPVTDVSLVTGLQEGAIMDTREAETLPTASADTVGAIYLIESSTEGEYERYITSHNGSSYEWIQLSDTTIQSPTIADNLTTNDSTKALSAKQGKVLNESLTELGQEVDGNIETFDITTTAGTSFSQLFPFPVSAGTELVISLSNNTCSQIAIRFVDGSNNVVHEISSISTDAFPLRTTIEQDAVSIRFITWAGSWVVSSGTMTFSVEKVGTIKQTQDSVAVLQAKTIEAVTLESVVFDVQGYYNSSTYGKLTNNASYEATSAYYPISPFVKYFLSTSTNGNVCSVVFYDEGKRIISYIKPGTKDYNETELGGADLPIPAGAIYARFSAIKSGNKGIRIEQIFIPTKNNLQIIKDNNYELNGGQISFDNTGASNATHKTSGSVVETTSPNSSVAEKIFDVSPGQNVIIYGYGSETYRLWAFADDLGNIIDKSAGSVNATSTPQTATAPSGATKLYVACYYNYINYLSVTIKTKGLVERVDDIEDVLSVTSIKGKKAYFIGDSVMIGQPSVSAVKNITSFIQDDFGCECHNGAAGGSVILYPWYTGNAYSIYYQLTQIPSSADYIIIQGGLNGVNTTDPSQQNYAPMGEISQSFTDTFDKATQIGCLEAICKYLYDNFSDKKYGFIMNYEIGSYDYWREKAELFMQVLKKWSIPVLDWRESGVSLASLPQYSKFGIDAYALYPTYDEDSGYSVDDKVIYNGSTYKANEDISSPAGAFDSAKWTLVSSQRYDTWHCNRLAYEKLSYITAKWMETL